MQTNYIQDAAEGLIQRAGPGYKCRVSDYDRRLAGLLGAEILDFREIGRCPNRRGLDVIVVAEQ